MPSKKFNPPKGPTTGQPPGTPVTYNPTPKPAPPKLPKPPAKSDVEINTTKTTKSKPGVFKQGGKVKKTGVALVHKNERVLTAKQAKKYKKVSRKHVASKA